MKVKNLVIASVVLTTALSLTACSDKNKSSKTTHEPAKIINVDIGAGCGNTGPTNGRRYAKRQSELMIYLKD